MISPFFSAFKVRWLYENVHEIFELSKEKKVRMGNIDTWMIYNFTNRKVHATDVTNACCTFYNNIKTLEWDESILRDQEVHESILPEIKPSLSHFGEVTSIPELEGVKITSVLGDQQAALFGQGLFHKGDIKVTYGTGCFMNVNIGYDPQAKCDGLLTRLGAKIFYPINITVSSHAMTAELP